MADVMRCRNCGYIMNQGEILALPSQFFATQVCKQKCYEALFKPGEIPVTEEELAAGGTRADKGKSRVDLIPPGVLLEFGKLLHIGAEKYEPHNWERGMDYSRMYGSMMRHLLKWWAGEEWDTEESERTGDETKKFHHLDAVIFGAVGLRHFELHREFYTRFDDRPATQMFWAEEVISPYTSYIRVGQSCKECQWLTPRADLAQCPNCDANGSMREVFIRLEEENERKGI